MSQSSGCREQPWVRRYVSHLDCRAAALPGWNCHHDGCPGGESPDDVSRRADRIVTRLCTFGGAVAIFTHGEFGCSLAARWIGLPVQGEHLQLGTASISILALNPSHPRLPVIAQ
jgi:broad specificity phosphatase PhoE